MPWTPTRVSASRTSSSLNGLMIATTIFMNCPAKLNGLTGVSAVTNESRPASAGTDRLHRLTRGGLKFKRGRCSTHRQPPQFQAKQVSEPDLSIAICAGEALVGDDAGQNAAYLPGRHPRFDPRIIEQGEQGAVVDREIADHPVLVEGGPRVALVMVGKPECVQQFVIGAVEEDVLALVDNDERHRVNDVSVGRRFDARHALRVGAADEVAGYFGPESLLQRGLKIFFIDQADLDVGSGRRCCKGQSQGGNIARIFLDDAQHRERTVDAAAADDARADRLIEAADAKRSCTDAQIGSERQGEKAF